MILSEVNASQHYIHPSECHRAQDAKRDIPGTLFGLCLATTVVGLHLASAHV